ncbi:MAG: GDP-mannose 4,6-dehydratase [Verrucomicrobiota bacterium]
MLWDACVPDDFVFATGRLHSVRDVLQFAFESVGLDWRTWVKHDPSLVRPSEPTLLAGNPSRAKRTLGWQNSTVLIDLIHEMTRTHSSALAV